MLSMKMVGYIVKIFSFASACESTISMYTFYGSVIGFPVFVDTFSLATSF